MDINSLKDNLNKSLADVSTKGIPSANFEPVWINNITRLNAQNLNARMYPTIASYITGYGNAVFEGSNEQLSNLLSILPGYKVTDTSTSEIHNLDSDLSSTNEADGAYQAVFGVGNIAQPTVTGQFLIGTYSDPYPDTLFAVGNGSNDNQKSNALEVTLDGTLKSSKINVADDITAKYITLTEVITDSSNDKYAATKKYVFDKVKTESDRAIAAENTLTTNLNNEISRAKAEESSIRAIASSAFHFKGTKDSYNDLPKSGNTQGDVWQVGDKEYAWNGTEWVELGFNIDLSEYVKTTEMNTALSKKQDNLYLTATKPNSSIVNITSNTNTLSVNKLHISDYSSAQGPAAVLSLGDVSSSGIEFESDNSISYFGSEIVNKESLLNFITNGFSTEREKSLTITSYNGDIYLNDRANQGCKIRRLNAGTEDNDAVNLSQLNAKQDILVSGTNIKSIKDDKTEAQSLLGPDSLSFKTINNQSLLGSGNITIEGGGGATITVDAELSETSTNPVQNKIITGALNAKQDKFATVTNVDSTQKVTIADTLTITTNPNLLADQIISTRALYLQGSPTSGVILGKTVLEGSSDFDATAGYLRVRDNPLADDFAVNKKYVDDSVNTKLSATTDKYSISWDNTNEAIKITFKE